MHRIHLHCTLCPQSVILVFRPPHSSVYLDGYLQELCYRVLKIFVAVITIAPLVGSFLKSTSRGQRVNCLYTDVAKINKVVN